MFPELIHVFKGKFEEIAIYHKPLEAQKKDSSISISKVIFNNLKCEADNFEISISQCDFMEMLFKDFEAPYIGISKCSNFKNDKQDSSIIFKNGKFKTIDIQDFKCSGFELNKFYS